MKALYAVFLFFFLASQGAQAQSNPYLGHDLRLFKGEAWELARAVHRQNTGRIKKLVAQGQVSVDYQEPRFGQTLLKWAVMTNRYRAAQALLESGANPNLQDHDGTSAFMEAADKYETPRYVRLLLQHGGNPNIESASPLPNRIGTPLMAAAQNNLESVKLLVTAGANINYSTRHGGSALQMAFIRKQVETVMYLLMEQQANFNRSFGTRTDGSQIRIADLLRHWAFPLDSDDYRRKMEIVAFLQARGVDYWQAPIPKHFFENYPKDFLDKY